MYDEKEIIDANQWLEINYPRNGICLIADENWGEKRNEIVRLSIIQFWLEENLTGVLDLSDFTNLKILRCSNSQISQIILPNPCQLEKLYCFNNQLTELILPDNNILKEIDLSKNELSSFDYHKLNPKTLIHLDISNNNFEATNLSVFSHLVSLKTLSIHNYKLSLNYDNSNFYGSFKAFKNCNKLEIIYINYSINRGIEYLPDSINHISFGDLIKRILNQYNQSWDSIEKKLKDWKIAHPQLVKNAKIITELEEYEEVGDRIKEAFSAIIKQPNHHWWKAEKNQLTFQMLCNENYPFRFHWLEGKYQLVERLRTENETYYQKFERKERFKNNIEYVKKFIFFSIVLTTIFTIVFLIIKNIIRKSKKTLENN